MKDTTQCGCVPWIFECLEVVLCAPGMMRAAGRTVDTAAAANVTALIDFTYSPAEPARFGDDGCPAEVAIRSVKLIQATHFEGSSSTTTLAADFDLLEILPEIEVEKLEEMLIQRAQNKAEA